MDRATKNNSPVFATVLNDIYRSNDPQTPISTLLALQIPEDRLRIFNPFDSRCFAWNVARDIDAPDTALQLANILIPEDKRETNRYFSDAARDLLCGIIQVFIEKGEDKEGGAQWQLSDLILTMRTPERVQHVLSQTHRGRDLIALHLRGETTPLNILSTARTKLAPFEVVAAMWKRAADERPQREPQRVFEGAFSDGIGK